MQIVRTSLGGIGQMIVAMTAWIFLMRILASISTEAVAGATITMRIMMFTLMPAWGMSNAAATLVGQNLGAGEPARAEAAVWRIGWMNMAFTLAVSVAFFFLHDALIAVFTDDAAVIAIGGEWLSILSYSYFVYGWWMVSVQAFNGAGDTVTPTWINVVFFWLIQIPLCLGAGAAAGLGAFRRVLGRVRLGNRGRRVHAVAVQPGTVEDGAGVRQRARTNQRRRTSRAEAQDPQA